MWGISGFTQTKNEQAKEIYQFHDSHVEDENIGMPHRVVLQPLLQHQVNDKYVKWQQDEEDSDREGHHDGEASRGDQAVLYKVFVKRHVQKVVAQHHLAELSKSVMEKESTKLINQLCILKNALALVGTN